MLRRIPFTNLTNLRDLGGFPAGKDCMTRYGVCYRSNLPEQLNAEEIRWLLDHGVTTVIDLRNEGETLRRPNCLKGQEGFTYHNYSMYEEGSITADGAPKSQRSVGEFYLAMVESTAAPETVLRTILEAPGAVLFHCSAGKDRTGIISALLLLLAGAADVDIVADYQVSFTYIRQYALFMAENNPDKPAYIYHSDAEFMLDFLEAFRARFGTVEAWLAERGFSQEDIETLKAKLREAM